MIARINFIFVRQASRECKIHATCSSASLEAEKNGQKKLFWMSVVYFLCFFLCFFTKNTFLQDDNPLLMALYL